MFGFRVQGSGVGCMMLGSRIVQFSVLGFGSFRFGPRGSGTHEVYGFYWSMRVQGLDGMPLDASLALVYHGGSRNRPKPQALPKP